MCQSESVREGVKQSACAVLGREGKQTECTELMGGEEAKKQSACAVLGRQEKQTECTELMGGYIVKKQSACADWKKRG